MTYHEKPFANPNAVLREESDNWAILFNPDTGGSFGMDPTSVFIWKRLDGKHSIEDIFSEMKESFTDVPEQAVEHIVEFINELKHNGLVY